MSNLVFIVSCIVISFVLGFLFCYATFRLSYTKTRYDGTLEISEQDSSKIHTLEITTDPEQLKDKDRILFKVRRVPTPEP